MKGIPFLNSTLVTAMVCSYYGDKREVYELMQDLSHSSRVCIVTTNGLKGFVVEFIPEMMLCKLHKDGQLEEKLGLTEGVYNILKD